jgi:purine-nucleoside phosphorylase
MITNSFDPAPGIISPEMLYERRENLPRSCIITFSKTVLDHVLARYPHREAFVIPRLEGPKTFWLLRDGAFETLFYLSPITSAGAGMLLEDIAQISGATHFVLFGSCGALDKGLTEGRLIVPTEACRDEGLSYHYAPAADYIRVKNAPFVANALQEKSLPFVEGRVWTTDALYRETRASMDMRRKEGCIAVDMECAGLQAVCDFRGHEYYTFFYTGDLLDAPAWDKRILDSGEKEADHQLAAFLVALEIAKKADERE